MEMFWIFAAVLSTHVAVSVLTFLSTVITIGSFPECASNVLSKESARLASDGIKCSKSNADLSENFLNFLRETSPDNDAIACHVQYLDQNQRNGWVWSSLGTLYQTKNGAKFATLATNCFKQANKLDGDLTDHIKEWFFLGPFVIGKAEVDGDPVEALGGIYTISPSRYKGDIRAFSELANHGEVSWEIIPQPQKDALVRISPHSKSSVNWNDLVNSLGSTGITEWQGWILGDFSINSKDVRTIIQCLGVHTVYVDGVPMTGDVYHRDQFLFSVHLSRGVHTLYIRLRTKVEGVFKCSIRSSSSTFTVLKPHFIPDQYDSHLLSTLIAIPVSNLHNTKWLKVTRVSIQEQSHGTPLDIILLNKQHPIAPGHTMPISVNLSLSDTDLISSDCSDLDISVKVTTSEGSKVIPLTLRCRKPGESFIFTFLDHDGSVQHGAAIEPLSSCDNNICPAVLTLHGTTVPAQNQADSYKHMVKGKFLFGLKKAWVVAPTRHGAHNWEGPGALTALTALSSLAELLNNRDWVPVKMWSEHFIMAGHSMGGHGAWHLATHFPDRTLALVSLAGWIKKEEYGDSNLFFRHDIGTSYVEPSVKAIMEMCVVENEADRHASNLQTVPVLTRIGAQDRTIHPYFVRRMYRILKQWNVEVTYVEIPKKEHWWWDTKETNDGGCVNDKQIRDFTLRHSSVPAALTLETCDSSNTDCSTHKAHINKYTSPASLSFTYTVTNPAFAGSYRGLRVLQQTTPHRTSTIKVKLDGSAAQLLTVNVRRLSITVSRLRPIVWSQFSLMVDGLTIKADLSDVEGTTLCLINEQVWRITDDCDTFEDSGEERGPLTMGPARRVAESPFLIVIGTQGDVEMSKEIQHLAVYIANLFLLTSDALAPIVKDEDLTEDQKEKYNLIILGTPKQNIHTAEYISHTPLSYQTDGSFELGSCTFSQPHTGALFLSPSTSRGPGKLMLVLMANDMQGLRDVVSLATPTIPPMTRSPFSNLIPDFIITGPEFRAYGAGGYLCTGFWDNHWSLKSELVSCSYCVS